MEKLGGTSSALILALCGLGQMARADQISFGFATLDVPGAIYTQPAAINDAGTIVGSYITSAGTAADTVWHGFLYSGGTFTTIDVPPKTPGIGPGDTMLQGINNAGQIVGISSEAGLRNPHAFELDGNALTVLDLPGHDNGGANGINNLGQIVGYFYDDVTAHGFLDANGVITAIDIPGIHASSAHAINDLGQIVLGGDTYPGFLYANGTFTEISFPGTRNTYLYGINNAGQIVGVPGGVLDPVGGFTPVRHPLGLQTTSVYGINNTGQIVGDFVDSSGSPHGFVATPVPEASSALLMVSELVAAIWVRRRGNRFARPDRPNVIVS